MTRLLDKGYEAAKPKKRLVDIFSYDILLFPVYNILHWTLAIVYHWRHIIEHYDSQGGFHPRCVNVLHDFIMGEHLDTKGTPAPDYYRMKKVNIP